MIVFLPSMRKLDPQYKRPGNQVRTPSTFRGVAGLLCLWCLAWVPQAAAQEAWEVSIGGLSGINVVAPGGEVQLYYVELTEAVGGGDAVLHTALGAPTARDIEFTLSDLTAATGFVIGDIQFLNFYRSTDAIFDGGDIAQQVGVVPGGGATETINFGAPDPVIPNPNVTSRTVSLCD